MLEVQTSFSHPPVHPHTNALMQPSTRCSRAPVHTQLQEAELTALL